MERRYGDMDRPPGHAPNSVIAAKGTFVGFGFGAIQAGLFLYEAYNSGSFDRLVVAEVVPEIADSVRRAGGRYGLNIAARSGIRRLEIDGIEILNPDVPCDRKVLIRAVADAREIATALPSVEHYGCGRPGDVVEILSSGLNMKDSSGRTIIYTAENHNHAAEILAEALADHVEANTLENTQCLNTVIGKMSGVVTDPAQIEEQGLLPVAPGLERAFLVEEFNQILISAVRWPDLEREIAVFEERPDLLPFEEAKLYGHNATHALLGYLAALKNYEYVSDAGKDADLLKFAREAFLKESGAALCRKHAGVNDLFTDAGYAAYADDLTERMLNPYLRDTIERVIRDPRRKLGWDDRLVGTMRLAREQGITPKRYAAGAAAALKYLQKEDPRPAAEILTELWKESDAPEAERAEMLDLIERAGHRLTPNLRPNHRCALRTTG